MILAEERMFTYDELASTLGVTRKSARRLVSRKGWSRSKGGDGRARIHVPAVVLHGDRPTCTTPLDGPIDTAMIEHVQRLERELASARSERDEARSRATDLGIRAAQARAMCDVLEARLGIVEARRAPSFWSRMLRFVLTAPH